MIRGYQAPSGTIIVEPEAKAQPREEHVVIDARVSSPEHREKLERQVGRLTHYCTMRGYQVSSVVKEIASGVNDSRPKLLALLKDQQASRIVVEHKDRLTRFGFGSLETLLDIQGRTIEVVNVAENDKQALGKRAFKKTGKLVPSGLRFAIPTKVTNWEKIDQVRIVPRGSGYVIEGMGTLVIGLNRLCKQEVHLGRRIHADMNGSYNTLRKEFPHACSDSQARALAGDRGAAVAPCRLEGKRRQDTGSCVPVSRLNERC